MAISNKALKKAMVVVGLTSIVGTTITPVLQIPMAHAETTENVDKKESEALKQADYSKLDKATADAKKAKIKVTEHTA